VLKVKNLSVTFQSKQHKVSAVDGISFEVPDGSVVGIVGESGSGKSVTGYSIMGLLGSEARVKGRIEWNGQDLLTLSETQKKIIRGREIGLIFQNPLAALNPVFSIADQMVETLRLHHSLTYKEALDRAIQLLQKVNIPDAHLRIFDYPHEFSLGMCQRIMIALTLSMNPKLLIADEPTASLDVTVQAQILELLRELKHEFQMSILIISHDLGIIAQSCDHIVVMYLGKVVETGSPQAIFHAPKHPYTQALIAAIPSADPDKKNTAKPLTGEMPSPVNLPKGCRFNTRCPHVMDRCFQENPPFVQVEGSKVACFLHE